MDTFLYKISFDKSSYELNDDYERLSDYEKEIIASINAESFYDYDNEYGNYRCFIITNIEEIKSYTSILKNNLINYKIYNLSQEVIKNKINLENELKSVIKTNSQIKLNIFIEGLNLWILENLDIDTVLDRISEVGGVEKLRQVEKEFLYNYKTK